MAYRYRATPQFWRSYAQLTASQQASARSVWPIFKANPFDPRLRTHKIASLGSDCISVDIGTHAIYR